MYKTFHLWISLDFSVSFAEKRPPIKFYGVFDHFSRTYEVAEFWIIKLCLDVNDVTHANKHTAHAQCSLHVNFWNFLLIPFFFMINKDHVKQRLLLWPHVPFKSIFWYNSLAFHFSKKTKTIFCCIFPEIDISTNVYCLQKILLKKFTWIFPLIRQIFLQIF